MNTFHLSLHTRTHSNCLADISPWVPSHLVSRVSDPAVCTATNRTVSSEKCELWLPWQQKCLSYWNCNYRKAVLEQKPNHFVFKGVFIFSKRQKMKVFKSSTDSFYKIIVDGKFRIFYDEFTWRKEGSWIEFFFLIVVLFFRPDHTSTESVSTRLDLWSLDVFHCHGRLLCPLGLVFLTITSNNVPHTLAHVHTQNCGAVTIAVAIKYQKWGTLPVLFRLWLYFHCSKH